MEINNEAFQDRVLNLSATAIYVYDLVKGVNVYINEQYTNLTGYTLSDINQMSQEAFFALFHPDEQSEIAKHMEQVVSSRPSQDIEIEYRFKKANGQWMWCLSRDAVFDRDDQKKPTQFLGCFVDISDRKRAEIKLEQFNKQLQVKNQELEQFAYIASHDLQEPLQTVNSFTELLHNQYGTELDKEADQYMEFIIQATNHMSELVKGLLDYSRIGKDKQRTRVDCNALLQAVKADLQASIRKSNARIDADDLPEIQGYEIELRLLFQNLLSNAIKFRRNGVTPHIQITTGKENGNWLFAFQDNGIGIAEHHNEKIFVIFQRLHNRDQYDGTGIGLSHCRKIAELHGGKIWVDSQVNEGSTFYLTLPIEEYNDI